MGKKSPTAPAAASKSLASFQLPSGFHLLLKLESQALMATQSAPSNTILKQLSLLQPPVALFSTALPFFARISEAESAAMKKVEHYSVHKVTGDGRCMFRALVCIY